VKIPSLKRGDMVSIKWRDANSPRETVWMMADEFLQDTPVMEIYSVGYFVEKRDGYLRMVGEKSISDDFEEVVNRVFNIPVGCVVDVKRLK